MLGIQDTYFYGATLPYLMREHGLNARGIVAAVKQELGRRFNFGDADFVDVRLQEANAVSVEELEVL